MTQPRQFERIIRVGVAGLTITTPRISFGIPRTVEETQDTGIIDIYNLSPDDYRTIYGRGGAIALEAGYPETIGLIFDGLVQRVQRLRDRRRVRRITRITVGDTVRSKMTGGVSARSYAGSVAVRSIVRDLARDLGLEVGPLDAIPKTAVAYNFVWTGPTRGGLTAVLKTIGAAWYEDDGLLRVRKIGASYQPDAPIIILSPENGLIGTPTETDQGAEVVMFLDPHVERGGQITLEDSELGGDWRVVALKHEGDNWDGVFTTWADLRSFEGEA